MRSKAFLRLAAATLAGAVMMALELVGFRLYAPYFGYSIYVWGSMIAVVMAALALGYAIGGWAADRSRSDLPIYGAIVASGLYQAGVLMSVYSLLPALARYSDFVGTSAATLAIFAPPMALLAMVSPLVIRRLAQPGQIGIAAGSVYALATAGSMAGILATSFWLLPQQGVRRTLELLCAATLLLGLVGLAQARRQLLAGAVVLAALPFAPTPRWPADTVWATETPYNALRVARRGDLLILYLNNNMAQTVRTVRGGATGFYYDQFALGPLLVPARHAAVLGMGAGSSIAAAWQTAPELLFEAVEIDPQVVEAGLRWFGLSRADPRLHLHVADARRWLTRSTARFDLVQLDAYQGGPYIPFYLATEEFFRLVRAHMGEDALLMMNLFDAAPTQELRAAMAATLARVFPALFEIAEGTGNHMLYAFTGRRSLASIRQRLAASSGELAQDAASRIVALEPPPGTPPFTDDLAPVESLTRRMLASRR